MLNLAARLIVAESLAFVLGTAAAAVVVGLGAPSVAAAGVGLVCKIEIFLRVMRRREAR